MTLLVRDEEELLEANLLHHLDLGVDHFIVTDNRSVDSTRDILWRHRRSGHLEYLYEPDDNYAQSLWVTKMARLAIDRHGADWIINSDADEFWWPEDGTTLPAVLGRQPASVQALLVDRHNLVPRPDTDERWYDRMIYRDRSSTNALGTPLRPKVCHRSLADVTVGQGNHRITRRGVVVKSRRTSDLSIFHVPIRTLDQLTRKIAAGGAAYERSERPYAEGEAWRQLQIQQRESGLDQFFSGQVLTDEAVPAALAGGAVEEDRRLQSQLRRVLKD